MVQAYASMIENWVCLIVDVWVFDNANDASVLIIGTALCVLAKDSFWIAFKPAALSSSLIYIFVTVPIYNLTGH